VLWRYRRAVGRSMRATAPGSAPDDGVPAAVAVDGVAGPTWCPPPSTRTSSSTSSAAGSTGSSSGTPESCRGAWTAWTRNPDPDGRYRVDELFCHDNAWRPVLRELARRSDCVLLDVRGFTPEHSGATYEIQQLAQLVPLDRVLLLIDGTTDHPFLRATLDQAWHLLDPASPNRRHGSWHLLWAPPTDLDVQVLVGRSASVASTTSTGDPLTRGRRT